MKSSQLWCSKLFMFGVEGTPKWWTGCCNGEPGCTELAVEFIHRNTNKPTDNWAVRFDDYLLIPGAVGLQLSSDVFVEPCPVYWIIFIACLLHRLSYTYEILSATHLPPEIIVAECFWRFCFVFFLYMVTLALFSSPLPCTSIIGYVHLPSLCCIPNFGILETQDALNWALVRWSLMAHLVWKSMKMRLTGSGNRAPLVTSDGGGVGGWAL